MNRFSRAFTRHPSRLGHMARPWATLPLAEILVACCLTLALVACGAQPGTAAPTTNDPGPAPTPEEAHTIWITAVYENDLDAIMRVAPPGDPDMVRTSLRNTLTSWASLRIGGDPAMGKLISMENKGVRRDGNQVRGYSLWTYEQNFWCYDLVLAQQPDGRWVGSGLGRAADSFCGK